MNQGLPSAPESPRGVEKSIHVTEIDLLIASFQARRRGVDGEGQ